MSDARPVLLIDLSAIFRACWHVNADQPTSVAFEATIGGVHRAAGSLENPLVALCLDGRGSFRKELYPEYKAHREKAPEAMFGLFDRVKERLAKDGFLLWSADTFEADDLVATATLAATAAGHRVRIATHDKDLAQLLMSDVDILSTRTWEVMDVEKATAKFGVPPAQLGDWLALVGDSSDGIKGATGVGPKRAAELLTKYGDLDKLFDAVQFPKAKEFTPAAHANLTNDQEAVRLARKLVTLRTDAPIDFQEIYAERKVQPLLQKDWASMSDEEIFNDGAISPPPQKVATADGRGGAPDEAAEAKTGQQSASAGGDESEGPSQHRPDAAETEVQSATAPVDPGQSDSGSKLAPVTALVPVEYERQLEPRSADGAYKMAHYLYESRLFQKFLNVDAIFAAILRGRELGLGAATALSVIEIIEGQPTLKAHFIIDLAMRDDRCEYFALMSTTMEAATYETKRRGNPKPTSLTYTLEQAKLAGLVKPGRSGEPNQWMKRPAEMLRKTAGVQLARAVYPGAALGLYADIELDPDRE